MPKQNSKSNNARSSKAKRNGGNRNYRSNNRSTASEMRNEDTRCENDVSWYTTTPQLVRAAGSFPFSNNVGSKIGITYNNGVAPTVSAADTAAGIMTIPYVPVIGGATAPNDPVNMAMRSIYTYVRHVNSGHTNYDAPDLMLYILAMDSALAHYATMVRIYGLLRQYSPVNRYMPKELVEALGADFDNLYANMANFNYAINSFAYKIGSLCVPASMSYVVRHFWLASNIFTDAPDLKAQMYAFYPKAYYTYKETEGAGYLKIASYPSKMLLEDFISIGNDILDPLLKSEDINIMSGDILKAFGAANVMKLSPIDETYSVAPVYNPEVLMQIENATLWNYNVQFSDITQATGIDEGYLKQSITAPGSAANGEEFIMTNNFIPTTALINMHVPEVTPEMMMVATRLHARGTWVNGSSAQFGHYNLDAVGSEVCLSATIITLQNNGRSISEKKNINTSTAVVYMADGSGAFIQDLRVFSVLSQFHQHPIVYLGAVWDAAPTSNGEVSGTVVGPICDLDNYTVLSRDEAFNMHQTALISEFAVPQVGWNPGLK